MNYPKVPQRDANYLAKVGNILKKESTSLHERLNPEQKDALNTIMHTVHKRLGKLIFVNDCNGTEKTVMWNAITTKLQLDEKVVLVIASSGMAAILLQAGTTTHSGFCIPIKITDESKCEIKGG